MMENAPGHGKARRRRREHPAGVVRERPAPPTKRTIAGLSAHAVKTGGSRIVGRPRGGPPYGTVAASPVGGAFMRAVPRARRWRGAGRRDNPTWLSFAGLSSPPPRAPVPDSGLRRNDGEKPTPAPLRSDRERHRDGGEDFPSAARLPGIPSFWRRPESRVLIAFPSKRAVREPPLRNRCRPRPVAARICPHLRLSGFPLNARESAARGRRRTHGFRKADDGEGEGVGQGVFRPAPFPRRQFQ